MPSGHRGLQPRKQPRQARSELTRQRILAAAAHVFAEHGYAAGTTNRIAERARISIGSLYQYYPNKDAILVELLTQHLEAGAAAVTRRQEEELPDSLEEIIRKFVHTAIENHLDDPQLLRVMAEQAPRAPELLEKITHHWRARVAYVRELLGSHPEVQVGDTHIAARLVVSTIELLVHQLIAAPDPIDIPQFENELVAMLTRYLTGGAGALGDMGGVDAMGGAAERSG
ncbi:MULTISPECIES: TetR/AcrR family transcriptional regulator [unclassified Streptomyces]|uniref:TetR/AcrR family transcriptional regulator n=1 Tax=unclassified Streptomyces TaxID=2593676 RepID=UPI002DDBDC0A|nr:MULTISPECIES: TetR/AcrR family transcriptional regulator [unclassified Streptomyces]WSB80887.1 TetR/AcrR family transcriptional regulator [Streptomyces sp. NBC_01775]WSS10901.1 TetR/AcrR family transcriptional regulator [Streptomyces sp. NBC_01186]WSS39598.1 TetR/AcrR family transcriptional regulator [Streptomyces sp. NBC_01187]